MQTFFVALGIALIALGVTALAWQEISYTTHEKLLEIGPVTAATEREKTIGLSPALGTASLLSGLGLLLLAVKR